MVTEQLIILSKKSLYKYCFSTALLTMLIGFWLFSQHQCSIKIYHWWTLFHIPGVLQEYTVPWVSLNDAGLKQEFEQLRLRKGARARPPSQCNNYILVKRCWINIVATSYILLQRFSYVVWPRCACKIRLTKETWSTGTWSSWAIQAGKSICWASFGYRCHQICTSLV